MMYDLIVIGAGPGGLIGAAECSKQGFRVLVLEKNDQLGKKLLATGGGQCNITHDLPIDDFCEHYHEKGRYVRKVINKFQPSELMDYFEDLGVALEKKSNGKVFPKSKKASDVLGAMLNQLKKNRVEIRNKETVKSVTSKEGVFQVQTAETVYRAKNVLLATGGKSYPSLGTSGDGYFLAERLGHSVENVRPALAPVYIIEDTFSDLAGISLRNASVTVWRKNKKIDQISGDLLFTHNGLSGPVILNASRAFREKDQIKINFVKFNNEEAFSKGLGEHLKAYGKYTVIKSLDYYDIPKRVLEKILELSKVPLQLRCAELTKQQRAALVKNMLGLSVTINQVGSFEEAMVTAGGVVTAEVNATTMESRLIPGLYFAGEIMDVDGITGGFNLQFAFSSGYIAGRSILDQL